MKIRMLVNETEDDGVVEWAVHELIDMMDRTVWRPASQGRAATWDEAVEKARRVKAMLS